ncbi:MAG: YcxB family protein [Rhizomicrobium sp.]|jgi:hypothetical protein
MNVEFAKIEYRAPGRLLDSLKLRFRCSFYLLRYFWAISAVIVVAAFSLNAMSLWADPLAILIPLAAGLAAGTLAGPIILIVRRPFQKSTEIRANIGDEGIKIIGNQGFSYEANWPNLTWITEGRSAYVMKFKKLFVRLPKRGFVDQQEAAFRDLVHTQAPASALKWRK